MRPNKAAQIVRLVHLICFSICATLARIVQYSIFIIASVNWFSARLRPMSVFDCDYENESRAALEMAASTNSEPERMEWLWLALAWQALARLHDSETIQRDTISRSDPVG